MGRIAYEARRKVREEEPTDRHDLRAILTEPAIDYELYDAAAALLVEFEEE